MDRTVSLLQDLPKNVSRFMKIVHSGSHSRHSPVSCGTIDKTKNIFLVVLYWMYHSNHKLYVKVSRI